MSGNPLEWNVNSTVLNSLSNTTDSSANIVDYPKAIVLPIGWPKLDTDSRLRLTSTITRTVNSSNGYAANVKEIINEIIQSAERCLNRYPYDKWKSDVAIKMQNSCKAMWNFASQMNILEKRRIEIANNCSRSASLSGCSEHQSILSEAVDLYKIMKEELNNNAL